MNRRRLSSLALGRHNTAVGADVLEGHVPADGIKREPCRAFLVDNSGHETVFSYPKA